MLLPFSPPIAPPRIRGHLRQAATGGYNRRIGEDRAHGESEARKRPPRRAWIALEAVAAGAGGIAGWLALRSFGARLGFPVAVLGATLAAAGAHALLYAAVQRVAAAKARAAAVFLAGSGALLVALGGLRIVGAALALAATVVFLFLVGRRLARPLFPDAPPSPGTAVGFGIGAASIAGAWLAAFGAFRAAAIVPAAVVAAAWGARQWREARADLSGRAAEITRAWSPPIAAAAEVAFLLAAMLVVHHLGPESGFDTLTRYLPYVKLLSHFHALPDVPQQFPFILPQAGLTWAALFGFATIARRAAFFIALAACAAIAARQCRARGWPAAASALLVASCPLVEGACHAIQPDAMGWLAVLLLAAVATESDVAEATLFGLACGALAMLAWCSKYSTAGFALPVLAFAAFRARRRFFRFAAAGVAGAAAAGTPWLVHAWRLSGNPVFPLARSIFPSAPWRMPIDRVWGAGFGIRPGWRGWLLAPIDMTIHTNRFIEAPPGSFGVTLLAILLLVVIALPKLDRSEKVWLAAAAVGTALMWTRTPYIRYWIPALWLAVPAAAAGARRLADGGIGPRPVVAGLLAACAGQIVIGTFRSRGGLEGRDERIYFGRLSEPEAIDRLPGASALVALGRADPWARVWYTGIDAVGYADVVPLAAERWELAFHVPPGRRRALFAYLDSASCRYWAVANDLTDRANFEKLGIAARYWNAANVALADPRVTIYRIPARSMTAAP